MDYLDSDTTGVGFLFVRHQRREETNTLGERRWYLAVPSLGTLSPIP